MNLPIRPLLRLALVVAIAGLLLPDNLASAASLGSEPTVAKVFELPSGEAAATLKRFAAQSGCQVVFLESAVAGETTRAVSGRLKAAEALRAMLTGTRLFFERDEPSGSFAVRRVQSSPATEQNPPALSRPFAPAAAPAAASPVPDEAVVLSPFVVNTTSDNGYVSSVIQSGSRLRTDLKDVAASVTVLTNEFMDDLGGTDLAGPLALVAGAENDSTQDPSGTNSLNQGYVGGDFGDVNTRSGQVNVRGLGSASTTANYIGVISAPDRYNIERAEFLRGANSILFGLASPAGLVNYTTKTANLGKNMHRVQVIGDDLGTTRTTVDLNRVLFKDKLALRVAGVNSNQEYKVKTAFLNDERLFLTATYQPLKNTTVRTSAEYTDNLGRRPNFRTVQDNISGWLTLYNQYAKLLTPAQLAAAFTWDPKTSKGLPGNSIVTVNGQTIDLGVLRRAMDGSGATKGTGFFYSTPSATDPDGNVALPFATRNQTGGLAPAAYLEYFVRAAGPLENRTGYVDPQVTNTAIFPYDTVEMSALPGNYRWERGRKLNLSVDQRITDNLYLSGSIQRETFRSEQLFAEISQTQQIDIDINAYLPNNLPNPNFMRPFIYGRNLGQHNDETLDNIVVQGNYDFDFAKKTRSLGWLGFHRLTAIYSHTADNLLTYKWNWQVDNQLSGFGAGFNDSTRLIQQLWYIGDPVQVGDTSLRITGFPKSVAPNRAIQRISMNYFDTATNTWQQSSPIDVGRATATGGRAYTRQINDGLGASLQSFFWKRKIVTLVGARRDWVAFYNYNLDTAVTPNLGAARSDYTTPVDPQYENAKTTGTESVVFHATDWMRFFASQSENFAATAPRMTPLWQPIAPQNGKTTEYGVGLGFFGGKLSVRASAYNSSQNLATSGAATSTASLRINPVEGALYTALENANRLSEWWSFGPNGKTTDQYSAPINCSATQESVSKGYQVELFYTPTPSWRMALNFNKMESVASNIGKEITDFLAARASYYNIYIQQGLRADGTTNAKPSSATPFATTLTNTLLANYLGNIAVERTSNPGVPKYAAKFLTSYTFRHGVLKGFGAGGNASWISSKALGYPQKITRFDLGGLTGVQGVVSDVARPFRGTPTVTGGVFLNYARRILHDRVNWKVQLNAQNLFGDQGLRVIAANPDGSPIWGVSPTRTFQLTNTFDF